MKIIIIILQAILNLVRKRRDLIANTDKIPPAIKKSIIAWYSPKKQKLNNYDVIESYAEDFTRWRIDNTGVTTTQKKIIIAANTKLKYNIAYKGFGNSTDGFDIKYTGNIVMRYRYNKEDGTVDIEPLLGKMTDNLIVAATKEYPDLFGGVTIGNGKIKIGVPGIDKDIVLEAADIDHFKSCLK
jgi:hypothetical protein